MFEVKSTFINWSILGMKESGTVEFPLPCELQIKHLCNKLVLSSIALMLLQNHTLPNLIRTSFFQVLRHVVQNLLAGNRKRKKSLAFERPDEQEHSPKGTKSVELGIVVSKNDLELEPSECSSSVHIARIVRLKNIVHSLCGLLQSQFSRQKRLLSNAGGCFLSVLLVLVDKRGVVLVDLSCFVLGEWAPLRWDENRIERGALSLNCWSTFSSIWAILLSLPQLWSPQITRAPDHFHNPR